MWEHGQRAVTKSQHGVVHLLEREAMQINEVAGDVYGSELPFSTGDQTVPCGEAADQQGTARWPVTLFDQIHAGTYIFKRTNAPDQGQTLGGCHAVATLNASEEGLEAVGDEIVHSSPA